MKQSIAIDFDAVLHSYEGWTGPVPKGDPIPGALDAVKRLAKKFEIIVFTSRGQFETVDWLRRHGFYEYVEFVTDKKPPCICIVDDRAVRFDGDWAATVKEVEKFRAYWEPPGEHVL